MTFPHSHHSVYYIIQGISGEKPSISRPVVDSVPLHDGPKRTRVAFIAYRVYACPIITIIAVGMCVCMRIYLCAFTQIGRRRAYIRLKEM